MSIINTIFCNNFADYLFCEKNQLQFAKQISIEQMVS